MNDLLARLQALSPQQRQLLARRVRARKRDAPELVPVARGADGAPLAAGQRRMWAQQVETPGVPVNVVSQIMTLEGALDDGRLAVALEILVRRHQALRTVIEVVDGEPRQKVRDDLRVPLERAEITAGTAAALEAALDERAREQCWRPFDLEAGPLLRLELVALGPEHHALLVAAHNVIFDAWSYSVLIDDLIDLYNAPEPGGEVLPEPGVQFADFAVWQQRRLAGGGFRDDLEYWRRELRPPMPPAFPTDRPRTPDLGWGGRRLAFELAPGVKRRLADLGRREGATLFMTLAALVQRFVARRTESDDVVLGTLNANRSRSEIERAIGYFLNVVPLRTDLAGSPSFAQLLRRVRKAALGAQSHAEVPFESLVESLDPETEPGRHPFFDVLFVFENIPPPQETLEGLTLRTRDVDKGVARYDLTLAIYDVDDRLHGWIEYRTDLFEEATVRAMVRELVELVELAGAGADRPEP